MGDGHNSCSGEEVGLGYWAGSLDGGCTVGSLASSVAGFLAAGVVKCSSDRVATIGSGGAQILIRRP